MDTTQATTARSRFARIAAMRRADAEAAAARGDFAMAASLHRLADSQERMAAKRYEDMTARAI